MNVLCMVLLIDWLGLVVVLVICVGWLCSSIVSGVSSVVMSVSVMNVWC